MRLAISCNIFTDLNTEALKQSWNDWRGSLTRRESPAGSSTAPPTTQTNIKLVKIAGIVQQVLKDSSLSRDTKRQLEIVQASFENIEATIKQAEVDQALTWVRMATMRGVYIADGMRRFVRFRNILESAKSSSIGTDTTDEMQKNLDRLRKDIEIYLNEYGQSLAQLNKLEKDSREQAFTQYLRDLKRTEEAYQIKILTKAVQKHLLQYSKRPEQDFTQWRADFEKL
jgi:hypothetical protein